jgi:prepilin-type N-terminal cleavage/methylation domain-containing protein
MKKTGRGFTLSEIMVVIVILGVLSLIAIPVYSGVRKASLESAAMQNTQLINAAKRSFGLTVPNSAAQWAAASTDAAKLQLLISAGLLDGSPAGYLTMPGGYAISLPGGINNRTDLTHDGTPVTY